MGDTIWASAALSYLHEFAPTTRVTIFTSKIGAHVLQNNPHVTEILIDDKGIWHKLKNFYTIFTTPFSATFNFHSTTRLIGYLGYLGSPGKYYGIAPECKVKSILTAAINNPEYAKLHKVEMRILLLARFLGLPSPTKRYFLAVYPEARHALAAKKLIKYQPENKYVFLQVGANRKERQWHPLYFKQLVAWLDANGYICIFSGTPKEKALIAEITEHTTHTIKLGPRASILELASIIALCTFVVSNDTGPLHLAEALQKPMFCFFLEKNVVTSKPITANYLKLYICNNDSADYIRIPTPEEVIQDIRLTEKEYWHESA